MLLLYLASVLVLLVGAFVIFRVVVRRDYFQRGDIPEELADEILNAYHTP